MKKLALFLVLALMLASLFSVFAFAEAPAGEGEGNAVSAITGKIKKWGTDIKEQFSVLNTTLKDTLGNLLGESASYIGLLMGVLLLLECFFGYKWLGFQMFIAGAYVGVACGLLGFVHLTVNAGVNVPGDYVKWVIAGLCAVVFALLFMALKKAGLVIFMGVYSFVNIAPYTNSLVIQIALTAIIVLLSIFFFKYIFIHFTSLWGATKGMTLIFGSSLVSGIVNLENFIVNTPKAPAYYLGLLIAFFGILAQLKMARRKRF